MTAPPTGPSRWPTRTERADSGGELNGSQVDHLGSEGSLTYDSAHSSLYAVNAGSNTVSVFTVHGDQLSLRQVVGSGGTFPVSVAVHGDLVSVLNAQNGGSVQEFYFLLRPSLPGSGIQSEPWFDHPDRHHAVHPYAGSGALLARRFQADRDDEGHNQRH